MSHEAQGLVEIGKLALMFARINRTTFHEDGVRSESDTDHTVMLSLCACALADALYKDTLDIGKVSQFALVHDLVEVYAGDTNSINLTHEGKESKEKREQESLARITKQFSSVYPWVHTTIENYESLETKEARFVKVVDKMMTRITNILDHGAGIAHHKVSQEEISKHYMAQRLSLARYTDEFPQLLDIMDALTDMMFREIYGENYTNIHN